MSGFTIRRLIPRFWKSPKKKRRSFTIVNGLSFLKFRRKNANRNTRYERLGGLLSQTAYVKFRRESPKSLYWSKNLPIERFGSIIRRAQFLNKS